MPGQSDSVILILAAAPKEALAIAQGLGSPEFTYPEWCAVQIAPGVELARTGIGKSNAAGAAALLLNPARHAAVLSVGIGGSLPPLDQTAAASPPPATGSCIVATASVFADEGLRTPEGFTDCPALGFPIGPITGSEVECDPHLVRRAAEAVAAHAPVRRARIATVSTCSGVDALAREIAARTRAECEAMEGASVGLVAARRGVAFLEIRTISNTTGDRSRQVWDLSGALGTIRAIIGPVVAGIRPERRQ